MKKLFVVTTYSIALAFILTSCTSDEITEDKPTSIEDCSKDFTYDVDIENIISTNCAGCHQAGGTPPFLTSYAEVQTSLERVKVRALELKTMPPAGPLSEGDQEKIDCWIKQGNPEN